MNFAQKNGLLIGLFVLTVTVVAFMLPVAQDPAFHLFADTRTCLDIPNFGDVVSNGAFLLVGLFALYRIVGPGGTSLFRTSADAIPYACLFAAVALVSVGSAYYHWSPDNARLVWDRLPMTLAFMSFFSAVICDRIHARSGLALLPVLLVAGVASVFYWHFSEMTGQGDLRAYAIVQFFPMAIIPLIIWLFPGGRYTDGRHVGAAIGLYAVAHGLQVLDMEAFETLGGLVSGHTLKHLLAAGACYVLYRMVAGARWRAGGEGLQPDATRRPARQRV